ncbi:hypothetical protein E2C01_010216 [Portunus trituberculatus]|uniref:Uncharacterized protein n=1 Tax=Portunus trituberculatus TaxID=210409 RepID=A0A5B7D7X2_PORTR|nr:hypothetical protein [Portunus trituberculatus]
MAVVQQPATQTGQYLCASQNLPGLAGLRCVWSDLPGFYCESERAGSVPRMVLMCPLCLLDTKQLQLFHKCSLYHICTIFVTHAITAPSWNPSQSQLVGGVTAVGSLCS